MTGRLSGRVAFVTGASSGIGEATALALAGEGAAVALVARRADRLEALGRKVDDAGGHAVVLQSDITEESQVHVAVDHVIQRFDRLDLLVNNAGVMLLGPIVGADTQDWRRMISLNVLGLMYVTSAGLPHLLHAAERVGVADVVNVSSVAGRVARAGSGVYNASKWAVNAFSESLRQEVTRRGVRVTLVEPGFVGTELADHITLRACFRSCIRGSARHLRRGRAWRRACKRHSSPVIWSDPPDTPGPRTDQAIDLKHALSESREQVKRTAGEMTTLQAADIAAAVRYAVTQPAHVAVNELLIRPTQQER